MIKLVEMEANEVNKKRIQAGSWAVILGVILLTNAEWHFYEWYEAVTPYGTVIASIALIVALFCYMDIKDMLKDPAFYLMAGADVVALINLFLIGSNKGAILTVADFLLILYLANKIVLSKKQVIISMCYIGFFFIYWTVDVKGYFKGYNTNYGGLVLITGFFFIVYAIEYLRDHLFNTKGIKKAKWLIVLTVFFFAWGYNIIAWYRSRCALLGLVAFAVLILIPLKVWKNKVFYTVLTAVTTIGSVIFSLIYVWLGYMKDEFRIRIFYKDLISGREEIWSELWGAFIKQPITGIGSSYQMQLDWLGGMFEVHNGLLDILIVHGIAVFCAAIVFIIKRFLELQDAASQSHLNKCAAAGLFAMMMPAFMENYFIVPPYSLIMLILIGVIRFKGEGSKKDHASEVVVGGQS
ncbi:MAG: O-antigen ligase family protein [Lachnospiraceae bacterium]|nr:O-antigen ligase family protein [Lachnospiraceae bacterium]